MTLIVEDGTGLADAESYISVVYADDYHAKFSNSPDWAGADLASKERALRLATQFTDLRYGARFRGVRKSIDQALEWPRVEAADSPLVFLLESSLPVKLKQATAEAALRALSEDLMPDVESPGRVVSESIQVGAIKESVSYDASGKGETKKFSRIDALMQPLLRRLELRRS